MEISAEKSKVLINSNKDTPQAHILMNGETLEQVDSFEYLGALITEDREKYKRNQSKVTNSSVRCVQTIKNVEESKNFNCSKDKQLYKALVTSIALYGCES